MADKIHCVRKTLRLMPQEAELLASKAQAAGMNEAEYLRFIISQKPNDYPEIRLLVRKLINEVNHIGVNINQIVKNHNSSFYKQDDKDRLYSYMRRLNILMQEAVAKLGYK